MWAQLHDARVFVYTGGKPWKDGQATVVLIHGVLHDHSVWILQSRYLAHHGFNVLALDLPGQGRSTGAPPASVEAASAAVLGVLDALRVDRAALIGHSFGSLIALHTAAQAPHRVCHLGLLGTAFPMRVSEVLLKGAVENPLQAIDLVTQFSHSTLAPPPSALGPGTWVRGGSRALMRRVLASNPTHNVFHTGFKACDDYRAGLEAMARVRCPVAFILGDQDQMTPPKAAQALIQACPTPPLVRRLPAGHTLMTEDPEGTLDALRALLAQGPA